MKGYSAETHGEAFADVYDALYPALSTGAPEITVLAELCRDGFAIELGVGTGRVAIPFAQLGRRVVGIDVSQRMLARLQQKSHGLPILPVRANAAEIPVQSGASLVYAVHNTFLMIGDRTAQRTCLQRVVAVLGQGGSCLLETLNPEASSFTCESIRVREVAASFVTVQFSQHDEVDQVIEQVDVRLSEQGIRLLPGRFAYLRSDQLDTMAAQAGLRLSERWSDWHGSRFEPAVNRTIVSIYQPMRPI